MILRQVTPRHFVSATGVVFLMNGQRIKQRLDSDGYPIVSLWFDGRYTTAKVHHLVLAAWVGPRPAGLVADHINGRRGDNRATNLRWVTQSDNLRNRHDSVLAASGIRGVRRTLKRKPWQAYGNRDGRFAHIGYFKTKRDAILAKTEWEMHRAAR